MRSVAFSETVKQALYYERFHHPHPRVWLKMEVVWLKSQGLTYELIGRLAQVDWKWCFSRVWMKAALNRLPFNPRADAIALNKNPFIQNYLRPQ